MSKKKEETQNGELDPLAQAKNALYTYQNMKQSQKFITDMLDFHIKHAQQAIAKIEKQEEEALSKQTKIFNENP